MNIIKRIIKHILHTNKLVFGKYQLLIQLLNWKQRKMNKIKQTKFQQAQCLQKGILSNFQMEQNM